MRIRMLKTARGAEDIAAREYVAGQEYTLADTPRGEDLARVFLREGWAEEVRAAAPVIIPDAPPPAPKAQPLAAPPPPAAAPQGTAGAAGPQVQAPAQASQGRGSRRGQ